MNKFCVMEKASRRSAYASKQLQAGPAPLASFEDLPSDELESPEDFAVEKFDLSSTDSDKEYLFAPKGPYEDVHGFQLCSTTPDAFLSAASTPQIESDFDSQFTLTPGEQCKGDSVSNLIAGSLSSLSKEDQLTVKQKKGSALSLGASEVSETNYSQRKSSWTDIFRTGTFQGSNQDTTACHKSTSKKKAKGDDVKKDQTELKQKEKGKFLSMFKVGKKSSKNANSPVSPEVFILPNVSQKIFGDNLQSSLSSEFDSKSFLPVHTSNGHNYEGKENEQPKEIQLYTVHKQKENIPVSIDSEKLDIKAYRSSEDVRQISIKISDGILANKEYDMLHAQSEVKTSETVAKQECNIFSSMLNDDHESSESELAFDVKDPCVVNKNDGGDDDEDDDDYEDYEAEKLLAQDSSEIEEYPTPELPRMVLESYRPILKTSRQQRLEVTTIPVERPRSTTPINIAPLEAFIQSVSPSSDSKVDKIKLSLPGDQFVKLKSPKKNSTKSWADFCEEGLHSPRTPKRVEGDEAESRIKPLSHPSKNFSDQTLSNILDEKSDFNENQWVTFESSWDQNVQSNTKCGIESGCPSPSSNEMPLISKTHFCHSNSSMQCTCVCHIYGCKNCIIPNEMIVDNPPITSTFATDNNSTDTILSKLCTCACHKKYPSANNPSEIDDGNDSSIDSFNKFDISSGLSVHSLKDQDF